MAAGAVAELAFYNSGLRISALILLVPVILLPVFSPHVSNAFANGDFIQLRRDMFMQTIIVAVCALPLAAAMFAYPKEIMVTLFGQGYEGSNRTLDLIVFSQVMFALSLPWSNMLLMCNDERIYGFSHLAALLLAFPIALSMVGETGGLAIAIAACVANSLLFAAFVFAGITRLIKLEGRS
jgi:O-antigen/teichoic acid export membrane protein